MYPKDYQNNRAQGRKDFTTAKSGGLSVWCDGERRTLLCGWNIGCVAGFLEVVPGLSEVDATFGLDCFPTEGKNLMPREHKALTHQQISGRKTQNSSPAAPHPLGFPALSVTCATKTWPRALRLLKEGCRS